MLIANARAQVKGYLDIETAITDFDNNIDGFIDSGVKRLYPIAQREVEEQSVAITVVNGRAKVNLSTLTTPLAGVRYAEAGTYDEPVVTEVHANTCYLSDVSGDATSAKLYGLTRYTLADIPPELELAVIYFATAEFYKFLIGNKRKYNQYMTNGRAAVDNMQDMVDYFEGLANQHLGDRVTLYGAN